MLRAGAPQPTHEVEPGGPYARYLLGVLVVVYVFNFLDRQIVAILAEHIKADLRLDDSELGFLYGTAFAVFYAVFGIPLGRLADVWDRRRLIALGLGFWSVMTAVSGLARGFGPLALARIGVGVGEASATPAAYSLLSDCFPRARRATALAIYSSGIYVGSGLGLGLGGLIVDRWDAAFAGGAAPLGLRGWQAAFLAVGLPGLLLAMLVRTLREPWRGQADGLEAGGTPRHESSDEAHPWRAFGRELMAVLPPLTLVGLHLAGAAPGSLVLNLAWAGVLAAAAWGLTALLGNPVQWWALALGFYAAGSWTQSLALRDRPGFTLVFRTPALHLSNLGFALLSFTGYAFSFWIAPFFVRTHGLSTERTGFLVGGAAAAGGWLGVTLGGLLADRWRRSDPRGRLYVGLLNAVLPVPCALAMLWAPSAKAALALSVPLYVSSALWLGPAAATVQDLVLPRLRAVASAGFLLIVTLLGLALGPYVVGRLSVATGDLRLALSLGLCANGLGAVSLWLAARSLPAAEASRLERARAAGEAC